MLAKQLTFLANADAAGIVLGARVPIILTSRADSVRARMASCAVAALRPQCALRSSLEATLQGPRARLTHRYISGLSLMQWLLTLTVWPHSRDCGVLRCTGTFWFRSMAVPALDGA